MNWEKEKYDWPFWESSNFFQTENCIWHYQIIGEEDKPILFMIHGAGASSHSWTNIIEYLVDYQVVSVDLPGHRFSKTLTNKSLDPSIIISDLIRLSNNLKQNPSIFIGHSIGAVIAIQLAYYVNKKGLQTSAISINGALEKFEGPAGTIFPLMAKFLNWNPLSKYWVKLFNSAENSLKKLLSLSGSNLSEKDIDPYVKLMGNSTHIKGTLALISNWNTKNLDGILKQINFPLLFLAGERDGIVPAVNSVRASKKTPGSKLILIADGGHLLHEEKSKSIAMEIGSFYKSIIK